MVLLHIAGLPPTISWLLSIPLAVITSNAALGTWLARKGLFPDALTAEERAHLGPLADGVSFIPSEAGDFVGATS